MQNDSTRLAEELKALHERIRRMESLLRGADGILSSIRYDGNLSYSPADGKDASEHRRAYNLIEFLGDELEEWRKVEHDLDLASDDIWDLMKRAEEGRLVRYSKPVPEPEAA